MRIIIDTHNDAFDVDAHGEIARILRELATQIEEGTDRRVNLMDANGNRCGWADGIPLP